MRIAILSDIHANLEALQAVVLALAKESVDRVVCLGDVVGYNADPAACVDLLLRLDPVVVAGNHDRAVTGQITTEGFSRTAARAVAWTRARLPSETLDLLAGLPLRATVDGVLVAVHGALHPETGCETVRLDTDERRRLSFEALAVHPSGIRVCAFGHTHRLGIYEFSDGAMRSRGGGDDDDEVTLQGDALYLVNPGTVGQPRTADRRATYLVLDTDRRSVAPRGVAYDAAAALRKARAAGLLPRFSFVPAPIRASLKRGVAALGLERAVARLDR
jgi:predicted phosphodiesterase